MTLDTRTMQETRAGTTGLREDFERILYTHEQIQARVRAMGAEIQKDYGHRRPLVVGVLNGCLPFVADLVRGIDAYLEMDFMSVSSYGGEAQSSGVVRILKDLNQSIQNRHVLLVEDIIDTGLTARYLLDNLLTRRPASVEFCVLLDKREARTETVSLRYVGFECPNQYLVGYGLDWNGFYRNLPYIGVLKDEISRTP